MKKYLLPISIIIIIAIAVAVSYFAGQKKFWSDVNVIKSGDIALEYAMDEVDPKQAVSFYSRIIEKGDDKLSAFIGRSRAYARMNENKLAINDLDAAIMIDPESPAPHREKIELLSAAENFDEAVLVARKFLSAYPGNDDAKKLLAQAVQKLGEAHYLKGDYNPAISSFTESIAYDGQAHPDWYVWRAAAYVLRKIPDMALIDLEQAERLDPEVGGLYFWRGRAQKMLGRYDAAIAAFNVVLEADPLESETIGFVADIYLEKGAFDKADQLCSRIIDRFGNEPGSAGAYSCKGRVLLKKDMPGEAVQYFEKSVELNPGDTSSYFGLTAAYAGSGSELRAEQICKEVMAEIENGENGNGAALQGDVLNMAIRSLVSAGLNVPENAFFPLALGRLYILAGQPDMALGPLDTAVNFDTRSAEAHYHRGRALFQTGRETEALRDFDNAYAIDPNYTRAVIMQGVINRRHNNYGAAIRSFQNALEKEPVNADVMQMLARTLIRVEDYDGALKRLDQWIAADPESAEAHYLKGLAGRRSGNSELALKSFSAAAALCPEDARKALVMYNTGLVYFDLGKFDNARLAFDTAARLDALNPMHPLLEGAALLELGKFQFALDEFNNAINISTEMIRLSSKANAGNSNSGFHEYIVEQSRRVLPSAHYGAAAARAQLGDSDSAVLSLGKAQETGYADIERARGDDLLNPLRERSAIDDILIGILRNSKLKKPDIKPLAEDYEEKLFGVK